MKVSVLPEGTVILTGRVDRKNRTLLHLVMPVVSSRDARRLEKLCNSSARGTSADYQLHLAWGITDALEPYFSADNSSSQGLRVLNGSTILRVMNNRPPQELGDFAPILYQRAEKRLRAEHKLSRPLNGYAELESLFAAAIARELPLYWENWRSTRPFSEIDEAFIRFTTRDSSALLLPCPVAAASVPAPASSDHDGIGHTHFQYLKGADGKPVQLGLALEEGPLMDRLAARVRGANDLCSVPLTHARRAPREEVTVRDQPMSAKAKKAARKRAEKNGYFVDFTGRLRPIPVLNPATVEGIAKVEGVLDSKRRYTKDDYLRIARAATNHRCKSGVGGPVIVPESAEFYVRIFRAIQLTEEEVGQLSREELSKLTALAGHLHRLAAPDDGSQLH